MLLVVASDEDNFSKLISVPEIILEKVIDESRDCCVYVERVATIVQYVPLRMFCLLTVMYRSLSGLLCS